MTLLMSGGLTIGVSAIVFLLITLILVGLLLFAKAKLVPSGNVSLKVNGEKDIETPIGGTLLGALQSVSFITYSVFYFYGVNILRNIKEILPNSSNGYKVVAFLHYVLSVEFIKNIPYLTNYLQKGDTK